MKRLELFFRTHKRAMVWLIVSAVIGIASLTITGIGVLWKLSLDMAGLGLMLQQIHGLLLQSYK